jgi:hypothetical protein
VGVWVGRLSAHAAMQLWCSKCAKLDCWVAGKVVSSTGRTCEEVGRSEVAQSNLASTLLRCGVRNCDSVLSVWAEGLHGR